MRKHGTQLASTPSFPHKKPQVEFTEEEELPHEPLQAEGGHPIALPFHSYSLPGPNGPVAGGGPPGGSSPRGLSKWMKPGSVWENDQKDILQRAREHILAAGGVELTTRFQALPASSKQEDKLGLAAQTQVGQQPVSSFKNHGLRLRTWNSQRL